MKLKQAKVIASELNRVIHTRNLYSGHSRFISAIAERVGKTSEYIVTVENLQTGARVNVQTLKSMRDSSGYPVTII